jgi:ribose 5-phosphate isomerase B
MLYINGDRHGIKLAKELSKKLSVNYDVFLFDDDKIEPYPTVAFELCKKVLEDNDSRGILVCRTGIGMQIVSNKVKGIYASRCFSLIDVKDFRMINNGNVLCFGSENIDLDLAYEYSKIFLDTNFCVSNKQRIDLINQIN